MRLGKLSLVAVMALGTSAFAIDNVKVNGEAKVWYQTFETEGTATAATTNGKDFFDYDTNSMANVKLSIGATADLLQNLSAGVKASALTTLGLENNLVGDVSTTKFDAQGNNVGTAKLDDQSWVEELYLAYTMGKTTAKVGRQALSTPLAFTENWNITENTFEAAVLLNNDLPDTTLVGAWVGKHNGVGLLKPTTGRGTTIAYNGEFSTFGSDGAYAVAAINKSIPNTTVQAWYYNVGQIADAYWLQADAKVLGMVNLGVQYAGMNPDSALGGGTSDRSTEMFALKAAVDVAGVNVYGAYSSVNDGTLGFSNVATGDKTMMYTGLGSVYFDGEIVAAPDTDAWKIGASTKMVPGVTLSASYAEAETGNNGAAAAAVAGLSLQDNDYSAWDVVASTKAGPVDLTAIYTEFDRENSVGVKTLDNALFRLIASLKF
ncbi:OprD family outer membrane porin [Sulfuricurvum sp.]|uniref:OprD family outer membrane porin n=1 Tax=Sulfuricurvum sp. TaxID=2025608 RepID=UPI00263619E3|nr:OprD family outer membrane porin [Sulfuricurvum sp.]MDD2781710.1 OprD family outer membrane porin [Sulfuricurvum sp.]